MKDQSFAQYLNYNWESVLKNRDKFDSQIKPQDQFNKPTKSQKFINPTQNIEAKKKQISNYTKKFINKVGNSSKTPLSYRYTFILFNSPIYMDEIQKILFIIAIF